jgi:hypothetical protein
MIPPRRLSAATGRGGWAGLVFEEEAVWDLGAASPGGAFARGVQRDSGGELGRAVARLERGQRGDWGRESASRGVTVSA